jgi:RsiW-degrading membrane proteinase PrsW (M82 family)
MPIIFSLIAAIVPMSLYLFMIYRLDKHEREPVLLIFTHFIWGAVSSVLIVFVLGDLIGYTFSFLNFIVPALFQVIFLAPVIEEFSKGSFILFSSRNENFDNLTDGLVYGAAIGLGFGMTENALYFIKFGVDIQSWILIVIMRSGFSAVMHGISTSVFSAFIILSRFSDYRKRKFYYLAGFITAVTIHFSWNAAVSFEQTFWYGVFVLLFYIIAFIFIFYYSLNFEMRILESELMDETNSEILENLLFLYKKSKRFSNLNKKQISFLIKLGFMKKKLKFATKKESLKLTEEINILRNKLSLGL